MTHYPHVRGGLPCNECPNAALRLDEYAEFQGIPGLIDSPDESLYRARFQAIPPEGAWALPQPDGKIKWVTYGEARFRERNRQIRIDRLEDER